jgi:hypothetical protein
MAERRQREKISRGQDKIALKEVPHDLFLQLLPT